MPDYLPLRLRALPLLAADRARALVDGALDRVFDQPLDVRTSAELERLVLAGPIGSGTAATATGLGAFVAAATPLAQRALRVATKTTKAGTTAKLPSARMVRIGVGAIPVAMRLGNTSRRGVREMQLLSSYLMARLRASGVTPERGLVRALTTSIYLDPARRPDLDRSGSRAAGALTGQWVLRSIGGDSEAAVRARVHAWVDAVDRLDLPALATAWARRGAIDV